MALNIPDNLDEEEVINTFLEVAKSLSRRRTFSYYTEDDIIQECYLILEGGVLDKYDGKRPLKNYLSVVFKNRLFNLRRKNYLKPDFPCKRCPLKAYLPPEGCSAYKDKMDCKFYSRWYNENTSRQNIIHPTDIDNVEDVHEKNMSYEPDFIDVIRRKEIDKELLEKLDTKARKAYLLLKSGSKVKAADYRHLVESAKEIFKDILTEDEQ